MQKKYLITTVLLNWLEDLRNELKIIVWISGSKLYGTLGIILCEF